MNPKVVSVQTIPGHQLIVQFSYGETGTYIRNYLLIFGIFSELLDENYFRKARAEHETVLWPNDQDNCPDTLYLDSVKS